MPQFVFVLNKDTNLLEVADKVIETAKAKAKAEEK